MKLGTRTKKGRTVEVEKVRLDKLSKRIEPASLNLEGGDAVVIARLSTVIAEKQAQIDRQTTLLDEQVKEIGRARKEMPKLAERCIKSAHTAKLARQDADRTGKKLDECQGELRRTQDELEDALRISAHRLAQLEDRPPEMISLQMQLEQRENQIDKLTAALGGVHVS